MKNDETIDEFSMNVDCLTKTLAKMIAATDYDLQTILISVLNYYLSLGEINNLSFNEMKIIFQRTLKAYQINAKSNFSTQEDPK